MVTSARLCLRMNEGTSKPFISDWCSHCRVSELKCILKHLAISWKGILEEQCVRKNCVAESAKAIMKRSDICGTLEHGCTVEISKYQIRLPTDYSGSPVALYICGVRRNIVHLNRKDVCSRSVQLMFAELGAVFDRSSGISRRIRFFQRHWLGDKVLDRVGA